MGDESSICCASDHISKSLPIETRSWNKREKTSLKYSIRLKAQELDVKRPSPPLVLYLFPPLDAVAAACLASSRSSFPRNEICSGPEDSSTYVASSWTSWTKMVLKRRGRRAPPRLARRAEWCAPSGRWYWYPLAAATGPWRRARPLSSCCSSPPRTRSLMKTERRQRSARTWLRRPRWRSREQSRWKRRCEGSPAGEPSPYPVRTSDGSPGWACRCIIQDKQTQLKSSLVCNNSLSPLLPCARVSGVEECIYISCRDLEGGRKCGHSSIKVIKCWNKCHKTPPAGTHPSWPPTLYIIVLLQLPPCTTFPCTLHGICVTSSNASPQIFGPINYDY